MGRAREDLTSTPASNDGDVHRLHHRILIVQVRHPSSHRISFWCTLVLLALSELPVAVFLVQDNIMRGARPTLEVDDDQQSSQCCNCRSIWAKVFPWSTRSAVRGIAV